MANVNLTRDRDATSFASSSTSPSHGNPNSHVYDVFINHRGSDVKNRLASHLYYRLKEHGLRAFFDKQEMQKGEKMKPQIEGAIQTASVHIAIFSPNYAQSIWCLNELVQMLESGKRILPVFYDVKPLDVRRVWGGNGVYARSLDELEKKRTRYSQPEYDSNDIKKWRDALSAVAGISGFELEACNGDEGELLDNIVQCVKTVFSGRLDFSGRSTLQALPDSVGNLTGPRSLDLGSSSALQVLPDSVGNLMFLQSLELPVCLEKLPKGLTNLRSLDLSWCSTVQAPLFGH